jgi:hypothetical protein
MRMRLPIWTLHPHTHTGAVIILGMYFMGVNTPSWRMRSAVLWMSLDQLKQTLVFKMKKKLFHLMGLKRLVVFLVTLTLNLRNLQETRDRRK